MKVRAYHGLVSLETSLHSSVFYNYKDIYAPAARAGSKNIRGLQLLTIVL